jgi:uncharacterized protein HemX
MDSIAVMKMMDAGMQKSGSEFYAFLAVVMVLGALALVLWLFPRDKKTGKSPNAAASQACPECSELTSMEKRFSDQMRALQEVVVTQMTHLNESVRSQGEAQSKRLSGLEETMERRFREVHSRLDRHLEWHAEEQRKPGSIVSRHPINGEAG